MRLYLSVVLVLCFAVYCLPAYCAGNGNPLDGLAQLKSFEAKRESSSDPNWKNGNADARPIPVGGTLVLADIKGPGNITHIWCTIAANDKWYSRLLTLRMYWDDEKQPSVECPIGDFFAAGHGIDAYVNSLPVRVSSDGRGRNCYWPMPFRKSARITVTNDGFNPVGAFYYYVDWQKEKSLPHNTAYFHAQYRQEFPCKPGSDYLILDAVGSGHYVGTVQSVRLNEPGWYGEGDDFFYIDGEKEPSLRGTGTEDYFCDGWGFRKFDGPYYGVPIFEGFSSGDRSSVYRWHIPDPVPFKKSLRVEIEHKGSRDNVSGFIERYDDFATVAFWYQTEPHKRFMPIPPGKDRLLYNPADMIELEKFVSNAESDPVKALGTQNGAWNGGSQLFFTPQAPNASFTLKIPVEKDGVYEIIISATISWDYGIYQAYLDGEPLGQPVDYLNESVSSKDVNLGRMKMAAGEHKLTFKNVGKNEKSKGYYLGLDSMILRLVK